jgi:hypothetical protein
MTRSKPMPCEEDDKIAKGRNFGAYLALKNNTWKAKKKLLNISHHIMAMK